MARSSKVLHSSTCRKSAEAHPDMVSTAVILLVVAALMGAYLLMHVMRDKATPKGVAFTHGPVAAAGLVLVIIKAIGEGGIWWLSVVLFVIAAAGGAWLIMSDLRGTGPAKPLAILHGLLAVTAFGVLLYALARG